MIRAQVPLQGSLGIDRMCALAGVSRAGYYRAWQASAPLQEATELRHQIQLLRVEHRHYGHRRISVLLQRSGWPVNKKRVLRLMREDNLLCLPRRRFVPVTTDSRHHWPFYANLAANLRPSAANQLWVADITYVRLQEAFIYLAVLLDAFSRKVIGWALAEHLQASLAIASLEMALASRVVVPGVLVHHSDRGIQYACEDYAERLVRAGIVASMSRVGRPWDNAVAESFMRTLKREEVDGRDYRDLASAQLSIGTFFETSRRVLHYRCRPYHGRGRTSMGAVSLPCETRAASMQEASTVTWSLAAAGERRLDRRARVAEVKAMRQGHSAMRVRCRTHTMLPGTIFRTGSIRTGQPLPFILAGQPATNQARVRRKSVPSCSTTRSPAAPATPR